MAVCVKTYLLLWNVSISVIVNFIWVICVIDDGLYKRDGISLQWNRKYKCKVLKKSWCESLSYSYLVANQIFLCVAHAVSSIVFNPYLTEVTPRCQDKVTESGFMFSRLVFCATQQWLIHHDVSQPYLFCIFVSLLNFVISIFHNYGNKEFSHVFQVFIFSTLRQLYLCIAVQTATSLFLIHLVNILHTIYIRRVLHDHNPSVVYVF